MPVVYAKAFAPATVANVGPGFDAFGFAVAGAGDTVEARCTEKRGLRLMQITGDGGALPRDAKKNVVTAVTAKMTRDLGLLFGIELSLHKGLPLGSGLGSSSASSVAAAVAVNELIGNAYSDEELLDFARYGEKVACGAAHADNVAPSLFGGFCVVRSLDPLDVIRLTVPSAWRAVVVHPHIDLPTKKARAVLPKSVSLKDMITNAANAAAVVAAIHNKDIWLFGRAVMAESVVVPARRKLIPGFTDVGIAAMHAGASGVSISGAGPSMFALTADVRHAKVVAAKMVRAWKQHGIDADVVVSPIGATGARILTRRST